MTDQRAAKWVHTLPPGADYRVCSDALVVAAPDRAPYFLRPDGTTEALSPDFALDAPVAETREVG